MSGEQEPWVFRGGLTADLQVCGNAARALASGLPPEVEFLITVLRVQKCTCFLNAWI